jgi:carboxylesterase
MKPGQQVVREGAETINLQEGNSRGVLLLHGFGDTPQTLRQLAIELHSAGFDVRAPLLPGHGTSVADFLASRRRDWLDFARGELADMKRSCERVALVGLSMGGALAAILASENPDTPALVLLAPYLDMPIIPRLAASTFWMWGGDGPIKSNSPGSIRDPSERVKNVGYGTYSRRLLFELWRLAGLARASLSRIVSPTLIVQSRTDPRIANKVAERAYAALGTTEKKLVWIENTGHIITVDYGHEKVFDEVRGWLTTHVPAATTA